MHGQRQAGRQQGKDPVGVVQLESAGDLQRLQPRLPAQDARTIAGDFTQEQAQGLVVDTQHTVTPVRHMRIEAPHGAAAIGIQGQLIAVIQRQFHALHRLHPHFAGEHRNPAAVGVAAQTDLRLPRTHPAQTEVDINRLRAIDAEGNLACDQGQLMLSHLQIHRSGGVQLQQAAIDQTHSAPLTDGSAQVCTPHRQRQLLAE
ncbi:hypothetical protein D3C77_392250 [compost metagenome]